MKRKNVVKKRIYELSFRDGDRAEEDTFTLWIATNRKIKSPTALSCKEIDIELEYSGIDIIID